MKNKTIKALSLFPVAALAFAVTACDVDKTEDGEMPEVKVEGEAKLPKYDVEGPEVTTGTKKVEVDVPTIDIDLPEEEDNEAGTPATEAPTETGNE